MFDDNPFLSIVIPAYNESTANGGTLDILKNLSLDCEIIAVDDGSADNTAKVVSERSVSVFVAYCDEVIIR